MLIAIVDGESIQQIGNYKTMFPNVSFPSSESRPSMVGTK